MATSPTQVAVGPQGQVYVLYLEDSPRDLGDFSYGSSSVWLARSDDGGRSFAPPVAVTGRDGDGVVTSTQMASLFVAPDGDLFVSFLDYREAIGAPLDQPAGTVADHRTTDGGGPPPRPATQLRLTRSADGGRSWSPGVLVTRAAGECAGTQAAQGEPDGALLVTARSEWYEVKGSAEPVRDPIVSVSTDDGATFDRAHKISDDRFKTGACPDVAVGLATTPDGTVHAAWYTGAAPNPGVYHATSDDDGQTWSRPRPILTDDWVSPGDVRLVVDGQGAAWLAFEDRRDDKGDRVQVVRVAPGGAVSASPPFPGRAPFLAVTGDGVVVAWHGRAAHGNLLGSVHVARVGI